MFDLSHCNLCPRQCGIDRTQARGICRAGAEMKIARAALHFWEEPCLSGERGSGTVFFSGCNLGCIYCQNQAISRADCGKAVPPAELAEIFADLERQGAHNINLVTPTHHWLQIKEAVRLYQGNLPIVYNTSGYERSEAIDALADTVDVYLTDLKYADPDSAARFSHAADYPQVARAALERMVQTVGAPRFDASGMLQKGVVVRLLVLPSIEHEAMMNLKYLKERFGDKIIISIMNQYTPMKKLKYEELNHIINDDIYDDVINFAYDLGIRNAFIQEGETQKKSFIPDFKNQEF